ncbi:MAG TPA: L-histidine N(alpha)-methyltransferase [Puia sp.]|jgi:uncharacterized SAM-dependent methyltransferase
MNITEVDKGVGTENEIFYRDIVEGLKRGQKQLPSKYFYDAMGDELFLQIMASPEYYFTNCELEILREQTDRLKTIHFEKDQVIWMEISQKYTMEQINEMTLQSGFFPLEKLVDQRGWFTDAVWFSL